VLADATLTVDEVAEKTRLDRRRTLTAIGDLRRVELVVADGDGYRLPSATLRSLAEQLADESLPMDPAIGYGMSDDERLVLSRYFSGRTLVELPVQRAKRLIVLERLALEFDLGRHYSEDEVNSVLRPFHVDVAAVRRHLVDEGFLDRAGGEYWRSGGRHVTPGV
jgi:hypothetical protein